MTKYAVKCRKSVSGDFNMASKILYFGKINLNSTHIYDVYNGTIDIRYILEKVLGNFYDRLTVTEERPIFFDGEVIRNDEIIYKATVKEKTDTYIYGYLYKTSTLYYKEEDPTTNELVSKHVSNTESIEFYMDVFKELIGYYTSQRFGEKEILGVLGKMLTKIMKDDECIFVIDKYTDGLNIKEIKEELRSIKDIQRLTFEYKPANPDTHIMESIETNGKGRLEKFEEANLSSKSVIFTASSGMGLNISSDEINNEIEEIDNMQKDIDAKTATKNGYIKVEAIGSDGTVHSTANQAQVKKKINNICEFKQACEYIISIKTSQRVLVEEE